MLGYFLTVMWNSYFNKAFKVNPKRECTAPCPPPPRSDGTDPTPTLFRFFEPTLRIFGQAIEFDYS